MAGHGYALLGFGWGVVFFIAFLALVILGIIALLRYIKVTAHTHQIEIPSFITAIQILSERYARGEISDEEYRIKKQEILKR
jgi:putative membrane protein